VDVEVKSCPQCYGPAELELDGDVALYVCTECGSEFGHTKAGQQDGMCQAGIVRLEPEQDAPVFIGSIGRRPE
jgi:hypothetical protein